MASESKPGRTSVGKSGAKTAAPRASRHGGLAQMLSMDSERSARILLFGAVGLILVAALGFIGFGYWYAEVRPEGRTVLQAEGVDVSFASMKRRMQYEIVRNPTYLQAVSVVPEAAYIGLLNEITLITKAESEFGVTASTEEIDARIRQRIGVAPEADVRQFADAFRGALDSSGLTEGEYRRLVQAEILERKIKDQFIAEVPDSVEQAKVEVIGAANIEIAQQARERVVAGEDWATVAREVSNEQQVAQTGGLQKYAYNGELNQAFNDYAFEAEPGEISEPLSIVEGSPPFYIVRVVDRSEQPLVAEQVPGYAQSQFDQWLTDTQETMSVDDNWDLEDQREALGEINLDPLAQNPIVVPTIPSGATITAPTGTPTVTPVATPTSATPAATATAEVPPADPADGPAVDPGDDSQAPQPDDGQ